MAKKNSRRCSITNLVRYPDRLEAEIALSNIHSQNARNNHRAFRDEPTETFYCTYCGSHHLRRARKATV